VEIVERALSAFNKGADAFVELTTADVESKVGLAAVEDEVFRGAGGREGLLRQTWQRIIRNAEAFISRNGS
jgi:hypothetical protein